MGGRIGTVGMKRAAMALAIGLAIYGVAVGAGALLYTTGAIATGATHNNCDRAVIARTLGKAQDDLTQQELKTETQKCLDGHTLTNGEAFRSEYLFWSAWPAALCAAVFVAWPAWVRILRKQEEAERAAEASRLEMGT
jgi:hypothetical protein